MIARQRACRSVAVGWFVAMVAASAALWPADAAAARKVQVSGPSGDEAVRALGGRLIEDYGAFRLYEVPDAAAPRVIGRGGEDRSDFDRIRLSVGDLDTTAAPAPVRPGTAAPAGRSLRLVQFPGPIRPEWRQSLEDAGCRIVAYVPENAYLVYGDASSAARMRASRAGVRIQWESAFDAAWKVHPRAGGRDLAGRTHAVATNAVTVQLVDDPAENAVTLAMIDGVRLGPAARQRRGQGVVNVRVNAPAGALAWLASRPDVVSILPAPRRRLHDERQGQIVAGVLSGGAPTGPGYLTWLASAGFTQQQFSASGFVVDVTDSGLDDGSTTPNHYGLYAGGDTSAASRVAYCRLEGTAHAGSTIQGCDGHGTLNAHIVAGFSARPAGFPHTDGSGYHYGLGICPFVRVGSSVIFDPSTFTNPDYQDLQSRAYRDGARISANSWGASTYGDYDADAQAYDALVRDAQPAGSAIAVTGNQEIVIVFSAGNDGPAAGSIGSPGTAKNVISVGAGENVQAFGGADGSGIGDSGANSAEDIISFSSRGPCADGRRKPELVAPGTHVSGGVAQDGSPGSNGTSLACYDGTGVSGGVGGAAFYPAGQKFFTASSGTSHSCPAVAGACALLRQYFLNRGLAAPSPAMTKAYLVNATRYMTGVSAGDTLWSASQGWGGLNLGTAFDGSPRMMRDQEISDTFTASGQSRVFRGRVADPARPFRVSLAWTDAPGSTVGAAYNNNLDLAVSVGGVAYKGNVFSGAYSAGGGSADAKDNLECVFRPAGETGDFTVTITATSVNSDGVPNWGGVLDQDFALVVYNGAAATQAVLSIAGSSYSDAAGGNGDGTIDEGEVIRETVVLHNAGAAPATGVTAVVSTTNADVTVLQAGASYGDMPTGASATNGSPFSYRVGKTVPWGTLVGFTHVSSSGSLSFTNVFSRRVGRLQAGGGVTNRIVNPDAPRSIPDGGIMLSTNTVSLPGDPVVEDVNVLLHINHTYDGDLTLRLQRPGFDGVLLANRRGGGGDNFGTDFWGAGGVPAVFDDEAAVSIASGGAVAPFAGTYRPEGVLTNYDGQAANGVWVLSVVDAREPDTGTLFGWALDIATRAAGYTGSVFNTAPTATPLAAAVLRNTPVVVSLSGSDADGDGLTYATNALPAHGALTDFDALSGLVTYAPAPGYTGVDAFAYSVSDGLTSSVPALVSLTIEATGSIWTISAAAGPNGTVAPTNQQVASGEDAAVWIEAAAWHVISDIRTNGVPVGGAFGMPATNFIWPAVGADGALYAGFAPRRTTNGSALWWVAGHGLSDDGDDPDHDGLPTWAEYVAGTDPTNGSSGLRILDMARTAAGIRIRFEGSTNSGVTAPFGMRRATGLSGGWVLTGEAIARSPTGTNEWTDTTVPDGPAYYSPIATNGP